MIRTVIASALLAVVSAAPAQAELGAPIAAGRLGCVAAGAGILTSTTPVAGDHVQPVAEILGGSPDGSFGSVNLPSSRGTNGYQEDTFFGSTPVRYWAQLDTLLDGERQTLESDCAELASGAFLADVRVYDRPSTPVTFTGTRNHGGSNLGFTVPRAAAYVAEVDPGEPGLRVAIESFGVQEGEWVEPGEPRSATFAAPGVLDLGTLAAGAHALTTRALAWSPAAAAMTWRVTIREAVPETPVQTPVVEQPPGDPQVEVEQSDDVPDEMLDVVRPRVALSVRRADGLRRVRVTALTERCRLRITVRSGSWRRVVRRTLRPGSSVSFRVRPRGRSVRVRVLAVDAAGNERVLRRTAR
jgi:hypothetical protein